MSRTSKENSEQTRGYFLPAVLNPCIHCEQPHRKTPWLNLVCLFSKFVTLVTRRIYKVSDIDNHLPFLAPQEVARKTGCVQKRTVGRKGTELDTRKAEGVRAKRGKSLGVEGKYTLFPRFVFPLLLAPATETSCKTVCVLMHKHLLFVVPAAWLLTPLVTGRECQTRISRNGHHWSL